MIYKFAAYGHPNILATHKTTLEFTKDSEISLDGNCIVGVKADFELGKIKNFIRNLKNRRIRIILEVGGLKDEINAELNQDFNSDREIVIRKTDFVSGRTLAIKADKAAFEINHQLIDLLKKENKIGILMQNKE